MVIDWFTAGAQVINFVILVWLMKRFLYKPILNAIDAREKRIARELADADAEKAEAQKERDAFRHNNEKFDQERIALFDKMKDEARAERQRLFDEARRDADALRAKRRDALERDQQSLKHEITRRTQKEVFAIARKTLRDLAGTSLEAHMSDAFRRRLLEVDRETRESIAKALTASSGPAVVRSAFDLPAEQRSAIQDALNEAFTADIHVRFETAPHLIGGIEIVANGQKVAWSIADYLASLEKSVNELMQGQSKPQVASDAKNGQAK
jgi:F-type H+-transporting ATPase subunit b